MHFIKDQEGQKTGEGVNPYDISGNKTRNSLNESDAQPTCDSTPMVQQSATIHLNAIISRSREQGYYPINRENQVKVGVSSKKQTTD